MTFEQKDLLLKRVGWGALVIVIIMCFMHNLQMVPSRTYHYASIIAATFAVVAEYLSFSLYHKEDKLFFDPIRIFALSVLSLIILNLALGLGI
ncbi:hypothetical protein [Solitalea koreensis]|uniref:Uncharacterized protein n=1 Tax=Solitalea koreensis TaxID=543615 RepID=A0A521E5L5_9SPHI|nr:hypothetical protein [Solitalea koreensis]SMO79228.1 hypothetical protein SAMN06265350_11156 [Solitalea koreensis]